MKKELSPAVTWAVIAVVVVAVIAIGYKFLVPKPFVADTTGSDALMKKVQSGQRMYTPPDAALPQAARQRGGGSGYNLNPPSK